MLIDESDLSAARGAPVQRPITQPKHAGNSPCDGEFFNHDTQMSVWSSRNVLEVYSKTSTSSARPKIRKYKTDFSGTESGITERLFSILYECVNP